MITESLVVDTIIVLATTVAACVCVALVFVAGYEAGWRQRGREMRSLGREADRLNTEARR